MPAYDARMEEAYRVVVRGLNRAWFLIEKHQWAVGDRCPECHAERRQGHTPDCAISVFLSEMR